MITSVEAIDLLYLLIKNSPLLTDVKKPNGKICKGDRDENSTSEDIVLDSIGGINRSPVQKGVLLLNIYVNNLDPLKVPNIGTGKNHRDSGRLRYLSQLVQKIFEGDDGEVWIDQDTCFEVTNDDVFEDSGNNQHYLSFRISFYTIK